MDNKRQEICERLAAAENALNQIARKRARRRAELMDILEDTLKAEFGDAMAAATRAKDRIFVERVLFDNEQAKIVAAHLKPRRFRYYRSHHWSQPLSPTDIYGVEEIITADSEHPGNVSSYKLASVGDRVIRILKSDGTPSKKYVPFDGDRIPLDWRLVEESESPESNQK